MLLVTNAGHRSPCASKELRRIEITLIEASLQEEMVMNSELYESVTLTEVIGIIWDCM